MSGAARGLSYCRWRHYLFRRFSDVMPQQGRRAGEIPEPMGSPEYHPAQREQAAPRPGGVSVSGGRGLAQASSRVGASPAPARSLLDGQDVDELDVGVAGEQLAGDLAEGHRYLAVEVRIQGVPGLEGVEDAVGGVADLECVPVNGALLGNRDLAAGLQECGELVARSGLGLEQGENPVSDGHEIRLLSACVCECSAFR